MSGRYRLTLNSLSRCANRGRSKHMRVYWREDINVNLMQVYTGFDVVVGKKGRDVPVMVGWYLGSSHPRRHDDSYYTVILNVTPDWSRQRTTLQGSFREKDQKSKKATVYQSRHHQRMAALQNRSSRSHRMIPSHLNHQPLV